MIAMPKFVVTATFEVYAETLAEAGVVVQNRVRAVEPRNDPNMVMVVDLKVTKAKD